jgi:hypothetical protein
MYPLATPVEQVTHLILAYNRCYFLGRRLVVILILVLILVIIVRSFRFRA